MKVGSLVEVEYIADRDVAIGLIVGHQGFLSGDWHVVAFPHQDMKKYLIQGSRLKCLTNKKNKNNIPT